MSRASQTSQSVISFVPSPNNKALFVCSALDPVRQVHPTTRHPRFAPSWHPFRSAHSLWGLGGGTPMRHNPCGGDANQALPRRFRGAVVDRRRAAGGAVQGEPHHAAAPHRILRVMRVRRRGNVSRGGRCATASADQAVHAAAVGRLEVVRGQSRRRLLDSSLTSRKRARRSASVTLRRRIRCCTGADDTAAIGSLVAPALARSRSDCETPTCSSVPSRAARK